MIRIFFSALLVSASCALAACGGNTNSSSPSDLSADTPVASRSEPALYIPLTDLLPALVTTEAAPNYAERCGADGLICVRWVESKLAEWERFFGCDHRAVFPTVYRMLTQQTRLQLEDDPTVFDDPAGLGFEALQFYALYDEMITHHLAGKPIAPAWQTAMDAANNGDWSGGHDMLLAINAHVQRDMPFAVANTGLTLPDGRSRKRDHDRFNSILNAAYPLIVREVGRRYDPLMTLVADVGLPANIVAQQLVAVWREGVWRNAERLEASADPAWQSLTQASIEHQANLTALMMKIGETPQRRTLRDAYCEAALVE
ncbi:MAG: DUF5995 family protein [Paraperlucidibaca sp.]